MSKSSYSLNHFLPFKPWVYFLIFFASNLLLSYFSLALQIKLWIGLFGLVLPLGLALSAQASHGSTLQHFFQREFLPPVSWKIWAGVGAAALFVRFYKLTTLSVWPLYDEGLWSYFAIGSYQKWGWQIFDAHNNFPSAYAWGLGLLFKALKPGLFTLWLFPALLSTLTLPAGYWAARQFFSRSLSFLATLVLGFGFWPLFIGRISDQTVLTLFWECLFLGLLGVFLKESPSGKIPAAVLGAAAGAGFYIHITWIPVAALGGMVLVWNASLAPRKNKAALGCFLLSFFVTMIPIFSAGFWDRIQNCVQIAAAVPEDGIRQLRVSLSYLTVLFWGMDPKSYTFQPAWGGFFDPLLGAFCFLGLIQWKRVCSKAIFAATIIVLAAFLFPGMATRSPEPFRVAPLLPLLVAFCALGWKSLLSSFSPRSAFAWVILFLAAFGGLDAYHLFGRYHQLWRDPGTWGGYSKSIERYRAHFILDQTAAEKGPGLIFTSFVPGLSDQSLDLVDNSYNASQNPSLRPPEAAWAAVLTNVNNRPFLAQRFPQGESFALSDNLNRSDGGFILWRMPVTRENREALGRWQKASEAFQRLPSAGPQETLDSFFPAYPAFRDDPFLESFFWEKMADLYFTASNFKDEQKPIEALNMALERGDRAAHLFLKLGVFYLMEGNLPAARKAFQGALKAPGNQTQARAYVETLPPLGSGL